jgi:hypothetical protein
MAFPLTHLCVAWRILKKQNLQTQNSAQFLIGAIAPDAVHYRGEFQGALKKNIGATKKISHLCPVSDERWGYVTDNDGWVLCVKDFLRTREESFFALGYAAHSLTDLFNNKTLWCDFRTRYPEEAAKGYASGYYTDLHNIDTRLYQEFPGIEKIFAMLEKSKPVEMPGLISAQEIRAIQHNLLHEHFKNAKKSAVSDEYRFTTWEDTICFIQAATEFCANIILPMSASL